MSSFMKYPVLDQLEPGAAGGGVPAKAVIPPPTQAAASGSPSDEVETDELGYAIVKPKVEAATKPAETKVASEKKPEGDAKPVTGYGDEPPKVEEVVPPVEEKPVATDLGYELKLDGLKKEEAQKVLDFAKANELSQKAAQSFADLRKSEVKAAEEAIEAQKKAEVAERNRIRSEWHKELRTDPQFGGEKFAYNIAQAEKVVSDFMPHTKKMLTERGSMLPPYVMRDLAKLSETLHPTQRLVQGDPAAPDEKEEDDALSFYNTPKA